MDTTEASGADVVVRELGVRVEPFPITPALVAQNLSFGADDARLPPEMMSALERVWEDRAFTWPTTVAITRLTLAVEPDEQRDPPQQVWSRVSVLGTGWLPDQPVSLSWQNAFGFPGAEIPMPTIAADQNGFFGADLVLRTTPRHHNRFSWGADEQLVLLAEQQGEESTLSARQEAVPPHVVWQWIR